MPSALAPNLGFLGTTPSVGYSTVSIFGNKSRWRRRNSHQIMQMMTSSSSSSSASQQQPPPPTMSKPVPVVPRAAVSVVVRYQHHPTSSSSNDTTEDGTQQQQQPLFLLIQRGNPPNKGVWCVPGGKIEWGEATLDAAQREVNEEVKFNRYNTDNNTSTAAAADADDDDKNSAVRLAWHAGAFCTSDSISKTAGYHYLIAQCFAEVVVHDDGGGPSSSPPQIQPADDASDARWWTLSEIQKAQDQKETVPNLMAVMERAEKLCQCGMLPTTHSVTLH
jgi:ADP-ribose pyrophosphatase YjhB (NUDIX family)